MKLKKYLKKFLLKLYYMLDNPVNSKVKKIKPKEKKNPGNLELYVDTERKSTLIPELDVKKTKTKTKTKIKIPKTILPFFKNWLDKILEKTSLYIVKLETNMIISLNREKIVFRLNSFEFEKEINEKLQYGGFYFCKVEEKSLQSKLMKKIHIYNSNGLKFRYKLEKKGYYDIKNRNLLEINISSLEIGKEMQSILEIKTETEKFEGKIITKLPNNSNLWICTLWAESKRLYSEINSLFSLIAIEE